MVLSCLELKFETPMDLASPLSTRFSNAFQVSVSGIEESYWKLNEFIIFTWLQMLFQLISFLLSCSKQSTQLLNCNLTYVTKYYFELQSEFPT